jgi:hypothetical protein
MFIGSAADILLALRLAMIHSDPAITRNAMSLVAIRD